MTYTDKAKAKRKRTGMVMETGLSPSLSNPTHMFNHHFSSTQTRAKMTAPSKNPEN